MGFGGGHNVPLLGIEKVYISDDMLDISQESEDNGKTAKTSYIAEETTDAADSTDSSAEADNANIFENIQSFCQ